MSNFIHFIQNPQQVASWLTVVAAGCMWAPSPSHADDAIPPMEVRQQWRVPDWWYEPPEQSQPQAAAPTEAWMRDPFGNISADMLSASDDLHAAETQPPVEVTHPRVEQRLESLVKLLEKQCKSGGSGAGSGSPSRPATESTLRTGKDQQGPLTDPGDSKRKWAQLTPKQREKIEQARTEGFPPGYEDVLADYFLRLSRENASEPPGNETTSKSAPNK